MSDLGRFTRYQTPVNSPGKFSSNSIDSSKYFTPTSSDSSKYSTPKQTPKTLHHATNHQESFSARKAGNVTFLETTKFMTPPSKSTTHDFSRYSTPQSSRNVAKSLRFDSTVYSTPQRFSSFSQEEENEPQPEPEPNFTDYLKQTWLELDDGSSKMSEEFTHNSQNSTLVPDVSTIVRAPPPTSNTNPFDMEQRTPSRMSTNSEKLDAVLRQLNFLNQEFAKMKLMEEKMIELSQDMGHLRENLVQQSLEAYNMAKDLLDNRVEEQKSSDLSSKNIPQKYPDFTNSPPPHLVAAAEVNNTFVFSSEDNSEDDEINERQQQDLIAQKLRCLPALVKGHLTRRLMKTQQVQQLRNTIHDTSVILLRFKNNLIQADGRLVVTHQDISFHQQLCNQLESACQQFYRIFFNTPISVQMSMIRQNREYVKIASSRQGSERSQSALSNAASQKSSSSQSGSKGFNYRTKIVDITSK